MVIDFETTFYFHREGAGLLFGMGDPRRDADVRHDRAVGFPAAGDRRRGHPAAGAGRRVDLARVGRALRDVARRATRSSAPRAGVDGLFLINGFSGHGFQHSPAAGRILADVIAGRDPHFDLTPFSIERFNTKAVAGERYVV